MNNQRHIFNRYQFEQLLGQGGMGTVYHGLDTRSDQPVAIKVLIPEIAAGNLEAVARFLQEAEALRELNHPNIVKILATGEEDGAHYIVMEFISGGSLSDMLERNGQFSINATIEIALDIADALTRVHRLDIIHRDLKPSNVLLAEDGTTRLADFGLARVKNNKITQVDFLVGTLVFISPEVIQGMQADSRSDIWAFGAMLFEMLTGQLPFDADTPLALVSAITTKPTPNLEVLRPDAPIALVDLIYRMLEKDPGIRIPSVRLVGAELEAILSGIEQSLETPPRKTHPVETRFITPTPHPAGAPRHNLPVQTTPFIGREAELNTLSDLLKNPDTRLVTLLGPGGIGKTRLAVEVARVQSPNFENGAIIVPLAHLSSAEYITTAIAEAAGFQFFGSIEPWEQLIDFFHEKRILLVLDNFEHILDGADLIHRILLAAPGVKVLATSREKLNLQEEVSFRIRGLDFPEEIQPKSVEAASKFSAISLFLQSAKRARPSYELELADMKSITRICCLVNGIPLGIILAAAWVEMFSPDEIAKEINQNLDFLETGISDIPERHRSMRAVFDSTWHQLTPAEQKTFKKLSIFRGGFRRDAAQVVAGSGLRMLITLMCKSLFHRDPASGRYAVHELLRQYAEEQFEISGNLETVRNAHCIYYAKFMEERLVEMLGPQQIKALDEIEAEFDNVRQAWRWAVDQKNYDAIDRASESLFVYSDMRSRELEGITLIEEAREQLAPQPGEEPHPVWGHLLLPWYDLLIQSEGRLEDEQEIKKQAQVCLEYANKREDHLGIAHANILLGHFVAPIQAIALYEEALALVPRLDDSFWVRIRIGFSHRALGNTAEEIKAFQKSYERGRKIGESEKMGWALYNLGATEISLGDHTNAVNHLREANIHFKEVGTIWGIIWTNIDLSFLMLLKGDIEETESLVEEARRLARDANRSIRIKKQTLTVLAYLALITQDYQSAKDCFEEVLSGYPGSPEASLGLVFIAWEMGETSNAGRYLRDAFHTSSPFLIPGMAILCLPAAAFILRDEGDVERAIELLALAHHSQDPLELLKKWPMVERMQTELRATLDLDVFEGAWTRGQALGVAETFSMLKERFQIEGTAYKNLDELVLPSLSDASLVEPLSPRELEILELIALGLSNREISERLHLALSTVKGHNRNIFEKLQVQRRTEAVARARELGLV